MIFYSTPELLAVLEDSEQNSYVLKTKELIKKCGYSAISEKLLWRILCQTFKEFDKKTINEALKTIKKYTYTFNYDVLDSTHPTEDCNYQVL